MRRPASRRRACLPPNRLWASLDADCLVHVGVQAGSPAVVVVMEQACRAWKAAISGADAELWRPFAIKRFPRLSRILSLAPETPQELQTSFRRLYFDQWAAEQEIPRYDSLAMHTSLSEFVFTIEVRSDLTVLGSESSIIGTQTCTFDDVVARKVFPFVAPYDFVATSGAKAAEAAQASGRIGAPADDNIRSHLQSLPRLWDGTQAKWPSGAMELTIYVTHKLQTVKLYSEYLADVARELQRYTLDADGFESELLLFERKSLPTSGERVTLEPVILDRCEGRVALCFNFDGNDDNADTFDALALHTYLDKNVPWPPKNAIAPPWSRR